MDKPNFIEYHCDSETKNDCTITLPPNLVTKNIFFRKKATFLAKAVRCIQCNIGETDSKKQLMFNFDQNSFNEVDFTNSHIKSILPNSTFDYHGVDLTHLNLSYNAIEELMFPTTFCGVPALQTLDLSHNQISSIHSESFNGLTNLTILLLNYNRLVTLDEMELSPLARLSTIDLSHNMFTTIPEKLFLSNTKLTTILFNNNNLNEIPSGVLSTQQDLMSFDVSYNNLTSLSASLLTANLTSLNIDGNSLTIIDLNEFLVKMPNLKNIQLFNNPLNCTEFENARALLNSKEILYSIEKETLRIYKIDCQLIHLNVAFEKLESMSVDITRGAQDMNQSNILLVNNVNGIKNDINLIKESIHDEASAKNSPDALKQNLTDRINNLEKDVLSGDLLTRHNYENVKIWVVALWIFATVGILINIIALLGGGLVVYRKFKVSYYSSSKKMNFEQIAPLV